MKAFTTSQFGDCLLWFFCIWHANYPINRLQQKVLQLVYRDKSLKFKEFFQKDSCFHPQQEFDSSCDWHLQGYMPVWSNDHARKIQTTRWQIKFSGKKHLKVDRFKQKDVKLNLYPSYLQKFSFWYSGTLKRT